MNVYWLEQHNNHTTSLCVECMRLLYVFVSVCLAMCLSGESPCTCRGMLVASSCSRRCENGASGKNIPAWCGEIVWIVAAKRIQAWLPGCLSGYGRAGDSPGNIRFSPGWCRPNARDLHQPSRLDCRGGEENRCRTARRVPVTCRTSLPHPQWTVIFSFYYFIVEESILSDGTDLSRLSAVLFFYICITFRLLFSCERFFVLLVNAWVFV